MRSNSGENCTSPTNRIYQILAGKRAITADTALRLGRWFGTGADFWMNLQASYDLRLAEKSTGPRFGRPSYLGKSRGQPAPGYTRSDRFRIAQLDRQAAVARSAARVA